VRFCGNFTHIKIFIPLPAAQLLVHPRSAMKTEAESHLIFHPKKSSAVWLLVGSLFLFAGGMWVAQEEGWIGYLCAGFFALGILMAIVQLIPGSTYLRITEDGLSFAYMFLVFTIPWAAIDRFFVKQTGMTVRKMVAFNFVPSYYRVRNFVPSYYRVRLGRRVSSVIAKCEVALPDTYGQKAEDLAEILNRCLSQFKERNGEQSDAPEPDSRRSCLIETTSRPGDL